MKNFPTEQGDEVELLEIYGKVGFTAQDVIDEGRFAAEFFPEQCGLDFTQMDPFRYLYLGGGLKGVADFRPFVLNTSTRLRVTSASRKDNSQFFNNPLSYVGWSLIFQKDFVCDGSFKREVPKGAFLFSHHARDNITTAKIFCRTDTRPHPP